MRDWKLSFHTRTPWYYNQQPVVGAAIALKKIGYDAIEICCPHLKALGVDRWNSAERTAFKQLLRATGIEVSALSGHSSICHEDNAPRAREHAFFRSVLDLASEMEVKVVNTHASYHRSVQPASFFQRQPGETGPAYRQRLRAETQPALDRRGFLLDVLGELAAYATQRSVVIGLEDLDPSPAQFWENIIREIGSPGLKLNFQASRGVTPGKALRERADIVGHFHLVPPAEYQGWSRGEYIDFINALEEINYSGDYFTIEEQDPNNDLNATGPRHLRYFWELLA
jgi:sugar phosphate isomerase/epimerase